MKMGVKILGTKAEDVDAAEDRELFDEILEKTKIPRAAGGTVFTAEEAKEVANRLGYPVLVRPSYVLGGQGMKIAFNDEEIEEFIGSNCVHVFTSIAYTVTKNQSIFMEQIHCVKHFIVYTGSSTEIVRIFKSFQRNR